MQLQTLANALRCIEATSDLDPEAKAIFRFWLEQRGTTTVKAFATTLTKKQSQVSSNSDEISRLQSYILTLATVLEIAGAKAPSAEVRTFAESLRGSEHTISSYIAAVEAVLAQKPAKATKQSAPADIARVRRYVDLLVETQTDNSAFDDAVRSLSKDKEVSLIELRMITERFVGHEVSGKAKKILIGKIVDRQTLDARHATKSLALGR